MPDWLRTLADRTWAAAGVLVESPYDSQARAELEALAADYAPRYRAAAALATDAIEARVLERTRDLEREVKGTRERLEKKNETIRALREELRSLKGAGA